MIEDKVVKSVINKYKTRSETGIYKYKTTLDKNNSSYDKWLSHLQEELMDATNYIEKIKFINNQSLRLLNRYSAELIIDFIAHHYGQYPEWTVTKKSMVKTVLQNELQSIYGTISWTEMDGLTTNNSYFFPVIQFLTVAYLHLS